MTVNERRAARAARNESLFRSVNARLVELNELFAELAERSVFVCECPRLDCVEAIEMTLQEYSRVRADPRRFIVAASDEHVVPGQERIVERKPGYFVVEKIGVAAEIAVETAQ